MLIFSADRFFVDGAGHYNFDPAKLGQAHGACLRGYVSACREAHFDMAWMKHPEPGQRRVTIMRGIPGAGKSFWVAAHAAELDIVVDNTSPNAVDVAPYAALAQAYELPYEIVTIRVDPALAASRCQHGVPADRILKAAEYLDLGTEQLMPWWPHRLIENPG